MSKTWFFRIFFILLFITTLAVPARGTQDTITQVSTIEALINGLYDGDMSLGELKKYGDLGLGTFNSLDGEMLLVRGKFYQVKADGSVAIPSKEARTPFAAVTSFETDAKLKIASGKTFMEFEELIDRFIPTPNIFYAIMIEGTFAKVRTRSVPTQKKPYRPLAEVAKEQPVFDFSGVKGVMVGFRCPPYVKGINVPGYHLHFLRDDEQAGGHVLDFVIENATVSIDYTDTFFMVLPRDKSFYDTKLGIDREAEVKAIEK